MRRAVLTVAALLALAALAAWASGGLDAVQAWAAEGQRRFQTALARALRALRAGDSGALATLWGVAFAYGFFHAVGPGHGKVLLSAYGAGSGVPLRRMMGLGLAASLAQALVAVALVHGALGLFSFSRAQIEGITAAWLDPASLVLVALLGGWLIWRGARALARRHRPALACALTPAGGPAHQDHHHRAHAHATPCAECGHHHLPDPDAVARAGSPREAALLVGAIALRPCTGALFLLILTWRMGLEWQGITGVLAMGLGTASVTVAVAALSVLARDGALSWSARLGGVAALLPVLEIAVGALVIALALGLLGGAL